MLAGEANHENFPLPHGDSGSWRPESEQLAKAPDSKSEAIFPRAFRSQDRPFLLFSRLTKRGEGVHEEFFLTKSEEGKISPGVGEASLCGVDPEGGKASHLLHALVVLPDQLGKKGNAGGPCEAGSGAGVESEGRSNARNPKLGAGRGQNEVVALILIVLDTGRDFRVDQAGKPFFQEPFHVPLQGFAGHPPEVRMENPLHPAGPEEFGQGEKSEEDESQKTTGRFPLQNKRPEDELGVPGNDRLIEIKEDKLVGSRHVVTLMIAAKKGI